MSAELIPVLAAAGTAVTAVGVLFNGPAIRSWIESRARRETHDQEGWTEALASLKDQVSELRTEVTDLRSEVKSLRSQLSERDQRIATLEDTVTEQSHSLTRASARVRQLEACWPPGFTMPGIDPAHP